MSAANSVTDQDEIKVTAKDITMPLLIKPQPEEINYGMTDEPAMPNAS